MSGKLFMVLGLVATVSASLKVYNLTPEQSNWVSNFQQKPDSTPEGLDVKEMRYYFTAFRAILEGFERGLFNDANYQINSKCMDENTL